LGDGNTLILTEEELRSRTKEFKTQLALNCVGGKPTIDLIRTLEPGGVMVTYGGMAKQPVIATTTHLIFNGIALQGYWMTRWNHVSPLEERIDMLNYMAQLCNDGKFKPSKYNLLHISEYKTALDLAMSEYKNTKVIFTFD